MEIINIDKTKKTEDLGPQDPVDMELIKMIYKDPNKILYDETLMKIIVNVGWYSSSLCDALDVNSIIVKIDGIEYKMGRGTLSDPNLDAFKLLDEVYIHTEDLCGISPSEHNNNNKDKQNHSDPLPINTPKNGISPIFKN